MYRFGKYHGIGNDFIVVDLRNASAAEIAGVTSVGKASQVCDRRRGVGADGILAILPPTSSGALAEMVVVNADGSRAEMCGNGIRCVAKYLFENDSLAKPSLTIDTGAGPLTCELTTKEKTVSSVLVNMGAPRFERTEIPMEGSGTLLDQKVPALGTDLRFSAVSMGNPHIVTFVEESGDALMNMAKALGPKLESASIFPERTNVEFAHAHSPTKIEVVVWERGSGITQACGTGACATVVAACKTDRVKIDTDTTVDLPGGALLIRVSPDYEYVNMTGPVVHVFDGSFS